MFKKIVNFGLTLLLLSGLSAGLASTDLVAPAFANTYLGGEKHADIFYNEACSDCSALVNEVLPRILGDFGYGVNKFDYINERANRKLLNEYNKDWDIPFELQSHIEAFIDERIMIGGHVPESIIRYVLSPENRDQFGKLIVYQDKMHGEALTYKVLGSPSGIKYFTGDIKEYPIDTPITVYLDALINEEVGKETSGAYKKGFGSFFGLVSVSAFLDGLNPCAFAVLLFFIAFLFAIKKTKGNILKIGFIYIFGIFLAYLLIGVGIAQAFVISGAPHLMARVGAWLVIVLGIFQLIGHFFPHFPIKLRIPTASKETIRGWMYKATTPAAFIGGFLVGLCTFPCSGGIYVAIIGLFTASVTRLQGLFWLVYYNVVFVLPLVIVLFLAGNKKTTEKITALEQSSAGKIKIFLGAFMIALGAIILIFFT